MSKTTYAITAYDYVRHETSFTVEAESEAEAVAIGREMFDDGDAPGGSIDWDSHIDGDVAAELAE